MSGMVGGPLAPLERYLAATTLSPPPDLIERIGTRLLLEPASSAPRRFLSALRGRDVRCIARGLRQNVATAFRPGTRSMLLRAQAMAIVLVTIATVSFGGVAGLAATQHVTQQVVKELAEWSAKRSVTPPAAPVGPSTEELGAFPANSGPGAPGLADLPGSVGAPGQACGLPVHSEADHLQGSEAERCPDVPDTGDRGKAAPPANKRNDQGKADSPPSKRNDQGKAAPPANKRNDQGKAAPPANKRADQGKKAPSSESRARPSDIGAATQPKTKKPRRGVRDRD